MSGSKKRPEWVPENASKAYTSKILDGIEGGQTNMNSSNDSRSNRPKRRGLTIEEAAKGILGNDRAVLARAITLIESNAEKHITKAQELLNHILPHTGNSIRIGITGVPGAGKSTFIESLGYHLCEQGHRVAVLAVDPSSNLTGGSILGDKTRMERLSRHPRAFVRPSPSRGTLGGVTRKTRETMLLCEAAGYDVILIETVGVGQSEVVVRSMVDFFALLVITGAGDELQGMKKGIMEIADLIVVNKADGSNRPKALAAKEEYNQIVHYLRPATEGWTTQSMTVSAVYEQGLEEFWELVEKFKEQIKKSGVFEQRRQAQIKDWVYSMIKEQLEHQFFSNAGVKKELPQIEEKVVNGELPVTRAVQDLFEIYNERE